MLIVFISASGIQPETVNSSGLELWLCFAEQKW